MGRARIRAQDQRLLGCSRLVGGETTRLSPWRQQQGGRQAKVAALLAAQVGGVGGCRRRWVVGSNKG